MALSGFSLRLAYARALRYFLTGELVGNAELGRAVDRTGQWVTKWSDSPTPPRDYEVHAPMAAALDVDERWLIRGEGQPPRPDLYELWIKARARRGVAAKVAEPGSTYGATRASRAPQERPALTDAEKRAASKRRA